MYNPFAYGIAMALVEVPYLIVQAIVFVPTIYWMIHFVPTAQAVSVRRARTHTHTHTHTHGRALVWLA